MPERDSRPAPAASGERAAPASAPSAEAGLGRRFAPGDEAGCEFCGHRSLDRHCKIVCPQCGAVRDCSDP